MTTMTDPNHIVLQNQQPFGQPYAQPIAQPYVQPIGQPYGQPFVQQPMNPIMQPQPQPYYGSPEQALFGQPTGFEQPSAYPGMQGNTPGMYGPNPIIR